MKKCRKRKRHERQLKALRSTYSSRYARFTRETPQGKPLQLALECARLEGLPVFRKETARGRTMLVTSYHTFFRRHLVHAPQEGGSYHEYILGNCNLYLDVDAERCGNPQLYEDEHACKLIVEAVLAELYSRYNIRRDRVKVLALDSSDASKLSRHYVFNITDKRGAYTVGWRNSQECGMFIKRLLLQQLGARRHPGLYIKDKESGSKCIVDTQVYGNHKSLRTYMSGKPNAPSRLLRTLEEKEQGSLTPDFSTFLQSLICYFMGNDARRIKTLLSVSELETGDGALQGANSKLLQKLTASWREGQTEGRERSMRSSAPDFYMDLVKRTLQVDLYRVDYYEGEQRLVAYTYSHSCELAHKEHKGNHVYYIFNLRAGLYYQRCPSTRYGCHQKKGAPHTIPDYTPPSQVSAVDSTKRRKLSLSPPPSSTTTTSNFPDIFYSHAPLFPARAQFCTQKL